MSIRLEEPRAGRRRPVVCRLRRASAGVTLVEVLVAALILGLLAAGVFSALVFGQRTTTSSETRLVALAEAQRVAEQLREAITVDNSPSPSGLTFNAGPHSPSLLPDSVLAQQYNGRIEYTVVDGKFDPPGASQPKWSEDPSNPEIDSNGNPINDANYDLKRVEITVFWTPPGAS